MMPDNSWFIVYRDRRGEYRWRLEDTNDKTIADSAEGYDTNYGCRQAIENVRREAARARLIDISK